MEGKASLLFPPSWTFPAIRRSGQFAILFKKNELLVPAEAAPFP